MKKLLTGVLVMAFLVTAFVGLTYAHGPMAKGGYNANTGDYGVGYRQIELTESQLDKVSEYREEFYNESEELREELRDLNWELRDLHMTDASNEEIGAVEDRIEAALEEIEQMRAANQEKIESILTEEQLQQIEENRTNLERRFQDGNSDRYGRGFSDNRFEDRFTSRPQMGPGMMNGFRGRANFQGRSSRRGFGSMGPGMMGQSSNNNFGPYGGYGPGACFQY